MTTFITLLFIVGSFVMLARIFFGMLDVDLMPFSCPKCYDGGDDSMIGTHRPWYKREGNGIVYCRTCHSVFREHPNGSLVEDRPILDDQ
ncbi:MAG TPA: hypothetical protein VIV11_42065 [Kofleriaceae bacterium]